jgi:hypothetical protein
VVSRSVTGCECRAEKETSRRKNVMPFILLPLLLVIERKVKLCDAQTPFFVDENVIKIFTNVKSYFADQNQ